jgi:DNA-binding response OmpR family regulator
VAATTLAALPIVLLIEDDPVIGPSLRRTLAAAGNEVLLACTAAEARLVAEHRRPDLVLLDLGLPDGDGVDLCRELRARHPACTIVILTARTEEVDVVIGLDAGADDYLLKPFRPTELVARIRAHLRRAAPAPDGRLMEVGPLEVDTAARRVWWRGREVELRPKEHDLLVLLASEAGAVLTRERIMAEVWDEHWFGSTKTLDMHISALRRKVADEIGILPVTTLPRVGYRYEAP